MLRPRTSGTPLWHQARIAAAVASSFALAACGDSAVGPASHLNVERIALESATIASSSLGEVIRVSASPVDRNGRPVSHVTLSWSSSDNSVLVSEGNGVFRTVRNGSATVRVSIASSLTIPAVTAQVTILQRASRILLSVDTLRLYALGQRIDVHARVVDAAGTEVPNMVPKWRSTDPRIATVDSLGMVTARQDGDMAISVSVENLTTTFTARVKSALRFAACATSQNVSGSSCRTMLLSAQSAR